MSSGKSGGIGLFGILFWAWIVYMIFFDGDDKNNSKVEITIDDDPSVTDVLKQSISDIKTEIEISVDAIKRDIAKSMKDVSEDVGEDLAKVKKDLVKVKKEIKEEVAKIKEEVIPPPTEIKVVTEIEDEREVKSLDTEPEPESTMKKL